MEIKEILEVITPIFRSVFNDDDLDVTMDLTSDEIDEWSSLTQTILVTEIEKTFDVKFKLLEVAKMNSVKAIVSSIQSKV